MSLKVRKASGHSGRILPLSHSDIGRTSSPRQGRNDGGCVVKLLFLVAFAAGSLYAGWTAWKGFVYFRSPESPLANGLAAPPTEVPPSLDAIALTGTENAAKPVLTTPQDVEKEVKIPSTTLPSGCLASTPELDTSRHIVPPPEGPITLVCCLTTKGPLNIAVHPAWAPLGAQRFLGMVDKNFFSSHVGLFRALKGFLVQFGLAGDPAVQREYERSTGGRGNLRDDPQWLPAGPPGREIDGIKRYQKGYLSYAGAGPNSRGTQLIMAFEDNLYLGGGSPWEVPFGQLVGEQSFETLDNIYTGYGEKPSQGKIRNRGNKYLKEEFPQLDYVTSCQVTARKLPWKYEHPIAAKKIDALSTEDTKMTTK